MNSSQFRAGTARAYALGMKRTILSVVAVAVVTFTVVGCTGADYEEPGTSADDSDLPSDVGASEDALSADAGKLACTVSSVASGVATVGTIACWVSAAYTVGGTAPVCVWLSSAGVTGAKLLNGAAQCATKCGVVGAACSNIKEMWTARKPSTARIVNTGCTKGGFFAVEGDVCGLGFNRLYSVDAPESSKCVTGKPTGFWALSQADRNYIRDRKNCAARGL
jgi:hypothetical protein